MAEKILNSSHCRVFMSGTHTSRPLGSAEEVTSLRTSHDKGIEHSIACWNQGFNCAESVLRGVCHAWSIELTELAMRMATPFGGGVGRSEDVCGALSGAVMALGTSLGRVRADEDRFRSYEPARALHDRFLTEFGSTSCRVLNRGDFESSEHRARCRKFVEGATRIALDVLRSR